MFKKHLSSAVFVLVVLLLSDCSGLRVANEWTYPKRVTLGRAPNRQELRTIIVDVMRPLGYEIRTSSPNYIRTKYRFELPAVEEEAMGITQKRDRLTVTFVRKAHNIFVAYLEPECQAKFLGGDWRRYKASGKTSRRHQSLVRQVRVLLEPSMPQWIVG